MSLCLDKFLGYVLLDMSVIVCHAKGGFQLYEVVVGGGGHHRLAVMIALCRQKIINKLLAIRYIKVAEAALATRIFDEVLVGSLPVCLVGCLIHTLLEVVKKALLAFGTVEEAELFIDDGLRAAALDKLCFLHDAAVVLLLKLLSRVGINV